MNSLLRLLVIVCIAGPAISHAQKAEMPAPTTFNVGDTWEWRQFDNRTKKEEAKRIRTAVKVDGVLLFSDGTNNSQITQAFIGLPASKPWRVWPLEVGKKWVADRDWTRADGVSGNTRQDAEVVAYEEVTVPAGRLMAFKIEYRGWYRYSHAAQGNQNFRQTDTVWYAPDAYADVKYVFNDGYNNYTRELVAFRRAAP